MPALLPENDIHRYFEYDPNWAASIFFIVVFAIITVGLIVQIEWRKQHRWLHALSLFAAAECAGYIARLCLYASPNSNAFKAELIILILAPNLLAFCCYVVLGKLITFAFFQQGDAITINNWIVRHPQWIPRFYVASDILCLAVQGAGGGMLSGASTTDQINKGKAVEVTGLALQLFFVATFVLICAYVWVRVRSIAPDRAVLIRPLFQVLAVLISLLVLRNAYRTAEFSTGGFTTGYFEQNEAWYLCFDPTLMSIALLVALAFDFAKRLPQTPHPSLSSPAVYEKRDVEMQQNGSKHIQIQSPSSNKTNGDDEMQ